MNSPDLDWLHKTEFKNSYNIQYPYIIGQGGFSTGMDDKLVIFIKTTSKDLDIIYIIVRHSEIISVRVNFFCSNCHFLH